MRNRTSDILLGIGIGFATGLTLLVMFDYVKARVVIDFVVKLGLALLLPFLFFLSLAWLGNRIGHDRVEVWTERAGGVIIVGSIIYLIVMAMIQK